LAPDRQKRFLVEVRDPWLAVDEDDLPVGFLELNALVCIALGRDAELVLERLLEIGHRVAAEVVSGLDLHTRVTARTHLIDKIRSRGSGHRPRRA